jgi:hypothetical protein
MAIRSVSRARVSRGMSAQIWYIVRSVFLTLAVPLPSCVPIGNEVTQLYRRNNDGRDKEQDAA